MTNEQLEEAERSYNQKAQLSPMGVETITNGTPAFSVSSVTNVEVPSPQLMTNTTITPALPYTAPSYTNGQIPDTKFDYSSDFQKKILSMTVRDQQFLSLYGADLVKPTYFESFYFQFIFKNIIQYFNAYRQVPDKANLNSHLVDQAKVAKMNEEAVYTMMTIIEDVYSMELNDLAYVKDKVLRFAQRQNIKQAVLKIVDLLDKDENLENSISIIERAVNSGFQVDLGVNFEQDYCNLQTMYREEYSPQQTLTTSFPTLDRYLLGGMYRKFLYVLVAPPGRGKTTMLTNMICANMMQGKNIVFYSLEVPEVEILFKVISRMTGLTHEDILNLPKDKLDAYLNSMQTFSKKLHIKYFDPSSISVNALRSHLSRLRSTYNFRPDMIVVDYADNMLPSTGSKGSMYDDGGTVYADLVALGKEYNSVLLSASQPKVEAWEVETIVKRHLAESSKKVHIAHGVISLNQTPEESEQGIMRLYTAKMRKGIEHKTVPIRVVRETSSFMEDDRLHKPTYA